MSEQINSRIQEAVEAIKKASETNESLKKGLKQNGNLINVSLNLDGDVTGISIPVNIISVDPGETLGEEDMPKSTF